MKSEYGYLFWAHLIVIATGFFAWALFDWRVVAAGVALYLFQVVTLGDCIMSRVQFGPPAPTNPRTTFLYYYLKKLKIPLTNRQIVIMNDFIAPPLVLFTAIVLQTRYGWKPLWF